MSLENPAVEALQSFLDMPFVKQYGPLGLAFLGSLWLIWYYNSRLIPRTNQTWATEVAKEREASEKRAKEDRELHEKLAEAERQLFREVTTAQLDTFKQIHEEHARTSAARHDEARGWHEEARGWHGEVLERFDSLKTKKESGNHEAD